MNAVRTNCSCGREFWRDTERVARCPGCLRFMAAVVPVEFIPDPRVEPMAAEAHIVWAGWMGYLFMRCTANPDGSVIIPADLVTRWRRQSLTPYAELPANERVSDRDVAAAYLKLLDELP